MEKIALITGAGSGIGRALSIELSKNFDCRILAIGRRKEPLQETAARCAGSCEIVSADLSLAEGRNKIVSALGDRHLDYLVQNAAILQPVQSLMEIASNDWQKHLDINLSGPLFLTQLLVQNLIGGRILHISSGAAHSAYAGWGAYCTSKAAFYMLHQVLKEELAAQQIAVGSVRPGVVQTPMQQRVRESDPMAFPQLERFQQLHEQRKLADPAEVAIFLANLLANTSKEKFMAREYDFREDREEFSGQ